MSEAVRDDVAFADAFERGAVSPEDFHHRDHLRVALVFVRQSATIEEAAERMAAALRRFTAVAGVPEKYSQTLTVFWVHAVADAMAAAPAATTLDELVAIRPELLDKNLFRVSASARERSD